MRHTFYVVNIQSNRIGVTKVLVDMTKLLCDTIFNQFVLMIKLNDQFKRNICLSYHKKALFSYLFAKLMISSRTLKI